MQYNSGSSGGPQSGPSTEGAKHAMDPVALFLVFLPIAVLASIAEESNRYAQEIVKVSLYGHKQKRVFTPAEIGEAEARRRFSKSNEKVKKVDRNGNETNEDSDKYKEEWKTIDCYSVLIFLAIMIFGAATKVRDIMSFWSTGENSFGRDVPWVRNCMTSTSFKLHRRFLHFTNNAKLPKPNRAGREPLQKVRVLITHFKPRKRRSHHRQSETPSAKHSKKERVTVGSGGSLYCHVCYRHFAGLNANRPQSERLVASQIVKQCNFSTKGCPVCAEGGMRVCKDCWQTYDHATGSTSRDFATTAKGMMSPAPKRAGSATTQPGTAAGKRARK
jgi:hypothetical protein